MKIVASLAAVVLILNACAAPRIPVSYGVAAGGQITFLYLTVGTSYLVIDSGTRASSVTADFAAQAGWSRASSHRTAVGLGGAVTEFREVVPSPRLTINTFTLAWDEAWVLTADLPEANALGTVPGLVFGGLLGQNALHDVSLSFGPHGATMSRDHFAGWALDSANRGWITIDDLPEPVVIDTGFSGQLIRLKKSSDPFQPTTRPVVMTRWLDRIFPGHTDGLSSLEYVDRLVLGKTELHDLTLATIVVPESADPALPVRRLLMGLELLRGSLAAIDFDRHQLRLSSARWEKGDVDRLAVALSRSGKGWIVDSILPSHPSYEHGVRPGFRIEAPDTDNELDAIVLLANP